MVRKVLGVLLLAWASLGLHAGSDWKAQWINADRCQSATNTWQVYRKTVTISEVPERLVARIAADTKYWLWINGRLAVFEGGLKRGPSPDGTYYDPVDIAPYLVEGENTIAILLWHFGKSGFTHVNSGLAALLFEAVAPGIEILSDGSWQCDLYDAYQNTEAPFPNYRLPESNIRFDARLERIGWNQPDYATGILRDFLKRYCDKYPAVNVRVYEGATPSVLSRLEDGIADVALVRLKAVTVQSLSASFK